MNKKSPSAKSVLAGKSGNPFERKSAKRDFRNLKALIKMKAIQKGYVQGWSVQRIAKEIGMSVPYVQQQKALLLQRNPKLLEQRLVALNKILAEPKKSVRKKGEKSSIPKGVAIERAAVNRKIIYGNTSSKPRVPIIRKKAVARAFRLSEMKETESVTALKSQNIVAGVKRINPQLAYIIPSKEGLSVADKRIQELAKELNEAKKILGTYSSSATEKYYARDKEIRSNSSIQTLIMFMRGGLKENQALELLSELGKKQKE
ncbi:MAG TPA: hypothetical protein PKK60_00170 [archaeon]|nr:hypothetical protein [archaeon]